jgi:FdhE protein
MRQGQVAPQGKWTGNQQGGVKAPEPLILPDPATRFAQTAARLNALSAGHPMAAWLRFMAALAEAQHAVAAAMGPVAGPTKAAVEQAVEARLPVLAADSHRRDPIWRKGLAMLIDRAGANALPAPAQSALASLRDREVGGLEALADDFLRGGVDGADAAAALYVAAALQVYFTRLAASLSAPSLRLLPQRGLCPCCGSTPVSGVISERSRTQGARYLHCSLCATAWNHVRAVCITCGQSGGVALKEIDGGPGAVKAETCNDCRTYSKLLYQARDMNVDPFADDLATLGLDILVAEAGWSRHAPNPLLLVDGSSELARAGGTPGDRMSPT